MSRPRILRISASLLREQVLAAQEHLAAFDLTRRLRDEPHDRERGDRLPGARFADDAERRARLNRKRQPVDRAYQPVFCFERRREIANGQDGRRQAYIPESETSVAITTNVIGHDAGDAGDLPLEAEPAAIGGIHAAADRARQTLLLGRLHGQQTDQRQRHHDEERREGVREPGACCCSGVWAR